MLCVIKSTCARLLEKTAVFKLSQKAQQRLLNMSCQVERLASRGLVRVSGDDVTSFLQGIVTNDMKHFQENSKSLFTMFLNTKGRVLFDSIVYKTKNDNTYFIECDHQSLHDIVKHLKMYRVRRKIDIDSVDDEWKLWVIFNPKEVENLSNGIKNVKQEIIVPCSLPSYDGKMENAFLPDVILSSNATVYSDPRLLNLGCRVIAPDNEDVTTSVRNAGAQVETLSPWSYRTFRYRLGIGEGVEELPTGKCFPLEANCDYLHGVSFHKGCYIGQELTARTHHTGVVRKRLMPLILHSESTDSFSIDTPIEAVIREKNAAIGKLRGIEKNSALGLMRIAEALEVNKFNIRNIEGETLRPFWWPQELPKERMDSGSSKRS